MKLEFLPKIITLFAGAVVCLIMIFNDADTIYSLEVLLATLIIFYIIGQIAKTIIKKVIAGNMFVKRHDGNERSIPIPGTIQEEHNVSSEGNTDTL